MAGYAVQIEKEVSFQGGPERFSNVYTLDTGTLESFDDNDAIDKLIELEKLVHTSEVTFRKASTYGIYGPDATNVMREIRDLNTPGTMVANGANIYNECAVLIQFELPRSTILRRRRVGRKWIHSCGLPNGGGTISEPQAGGAAPLPTAVLNFYKNTFADPLVAGDFGGGTFASYSDPFTNPVVFPYLEHRQFKRGRKRS